MGLQIIKFSKATYPDLIFNSLPAAIRGFDPSVNVAMALTEGGELYTRQIGTQTALISIVFDKEHPLRFTDYDGNFNWVTWAQTASTQSLANWFLNVSVGALNSFTLTRGDDTATVNLMNNPLGFRPVLGKDDQYVGEMILRIQR